MSLCLVSKSGTFFFFYFHPCCSFERNLAHSFFSMFTEHRRHVVNSLIVLIVLASLLVSFIVDERSFQYRRSFMRGQCDDVAEWFESKPAEQRNEGLFGRKTLTTKQRKRNFLVYWTPHKTGSTSMRFWLKSIRKLLSLPSTGSSKYYPFSNYTDHYSRLQQFPSLNCGILMGHIRISKLELRHDELLLGTVITTTRSPENTLASKFFHRTPASLNSLKPYYSNLSTLSRHWFFFWHDSDPCEPLQYYDGLRECSLHHSYLRNRITNIASRIDCVVDMDDPIADLQQICFSVGIHAQECPTFPERNVKEGRNYYEDLFQIPHIYRAAEENLNVSKMLWNHLMTRRCRFLSTGNLTLSQYSPPRWPSKNC